jgi:hypothetical protein
MKVNNLRDKLINQIEKLEKKEIPIEVAREISRTSQAILESVRLELEYNKELNTKQKIDFLENNTNIAFKYH